MSDPFSADAEHSGESSDFPDAASGPSRPVDSPDAPDADPEGAVPPGYDWPTHGGYLGCLLGLIAACIVGGFVGSSLFAALTHYNWVPGYAVALIVVAVYVVSIVALSALGWSLGKRFYRAYPQARGHTWGEQDEYVEDAAAGGAAAEDVPAGDVMHRDQETYTAGETDPTLASPARPLPDEPANRAGHANSPTYTS